MTKRKSKRKSKRRRAYVRRRLTKRQQQLAEQYIPLANRWIWERALKLPKWIQEAVGSDGFLEAAYTAATEAALKYDQSRCRAKNGNGVPTHLFWRCRNAFTIAVHSTLRQIGANPDDSGNPQRNSFMHFSAGSNRFNGLDVNKSIHLTNPKMTGYLPDYQDPEDTSHSIVDLDPTIPIEEIIKQIECPLTQKILKLRFQKSWTLERTADKLGISREWLRVLQNRAFEQLRQNESLRLELNRYVLGSQSPDDILSDG